MTKRTNSTASAMMELMTATATFTEERADKGTKQSATAYKGEAAHYDRASKSYDKLGTLGIELVLTDSGLYAKVEKIGCKVGIGVNPETGKATYKDFESPKSYSKLDELSRDAALTPKKASWASACAYLEARYSLTQKDYKALVELARSGKRLMTKAERKASKAA